MFDSPYSTPFNTVGVGNAVPPQGQQFGSGDLFAPALGGKPATKAAAKARKTKDNTRQPQYGKPLPTIVYTKRK